MVIYCHVKLSALLQNKLRESLQGHQLIVGQELNAENAEQNCIAADVVFGNPPLAWVESSKEIKWMQLESVGLDPYQDIIKSNKIKISNLRGFFNAPVAESAIGGILMLYRKLHDLYKAQSKAQWAKDTIRPECDTLAGKNITILGGGSIGSAIKKYLHPFNANVYVFSKPGKDSDFGSIREFDNKLEEMDIIIGCLPENEETIGFLNKKRLSKLKSTTIIVNVGRGSLIDEKELIAVLRAQKLGGAFLDVTTQEPIPKSSELWRVPNLILGQHTGGGTKHEVMDKVNFFIENFELYQAGKAKNIISFS